MDSDMITGLTQRALSLTLLLGGPLVAGAAIVGLVISFLQAVTQIQDQTLATAFKVLVVFAMCAVLGSWMGAMLTQFGDQIFDTITRIK